MQACVCGSVCAAPSLLAPFARPAHSPWPPSHPQWFRFTAWLGSNSTATKQRRMLAELSTNLAASGHVHTGRSDVRLLYVPVLKELLTKPIIDEGEAGIEAVVSIMRVRGFALRGFAQICTEGLRRASHTDAVAR